MLKAVSSSGSGSTTGGTQALADISINSSLFSVWMSRIAKFKANLQNLTILLSGDSLQDGVAGSTVPFSHSRTLRNIISKHYGIPAHDNAWLGTGDDGHSGAPRNGVDTRITKGSSWSNDNATYLTMGGGTWTATTSTNALTFTPDIATDTLVVYYIINTGQGSFTLDYNGLGTVTTNSNGAAAVGTLTLTASQGWNDYNLKWSAGGRVDIIGAIAYLSTKKMAVIINAGVGGSVSAAAVDTTYPWSYGNMWSVIQPDLTEYNYGTNDSSFAVPIATYQSQLNTIITQAKATGDVLANIPPPSNPSSVIYPKSYAYQATYNDASRAVAVAAEIPYLDINAFYGTYEAGDALGYYYDTFVHSSTAGNAIIGSLEANIMFSQAEGGSDVTAFVQTSLDSLNGYYQAGNLIIPNLTASSTIFGVSGNSGYTGAFNSSFGRQALDSLTSGTGHTAVGYQCLKVSGAAGKISNTGIGQLAGLTFTGNSSLFAGSSAGSGFTTGSNITVLGKSVGTAASRTGSKVILIGTGGGTAVDTPTAGTSDYLNIENTIVGNTQAHASPGLAIIGVISQLGVLKSANFNSTADQAITISFPSGATKYIITGILVTNASTSLTTAVGGLYTAASKGGTVLVANTQVYTNCSSATGAQNLTLATGAADNTYTATTQYLSLTTAQGSTATADIYIFGRPIA